jgi:hypothetical protein
MMPQAVNGHGLFAEKLRVDIFYKAIRRVTKLNETEACRIQRFYSTIYSLLQQTVRAFYVRSFILKEALSILKTSSFLFVTNSLPRSS